MDPQSLNATDVTDWAFAPPLRNLLARKLGDQSSELGEADPVTPLV